MAVEIAYRAEPANVQPPTVADTLAIAKAVDEGKVLVPLTRDQLEVAIEALGSHAGRLVDEARDPDAYLPFAALQSHLHGYRREART
jgi:hypothetical protein